MDRRFKFAVVLVLGFGPLAACTPDTPETQFGWGVNDRVSSTRTTRSAPAPQPQRQATAKTYIFDEGGNYAVPAPKPRPAYTPAAKPVSYGTDYSGRFAWPANGRVIATFGSASDGQRNDGINIALPAGAPIRAAAGGTVTYSGDELKNYGNLLLIKHSDGYVTAYAHAEQLLVPRGAVVSKGQVIGYAGHTGDVSTSQLHFEIRRGTTPVNPGSYLTQRNS